tara:strand:+ start:9978 stop:10448 length:471 start_codon:yes stop_codon:yes gene_type:complete
MAFGDFVREVSSGRGLSAVRKEAKRLGTKAAPSVNSGMRFGMKATGAISKYGHKISDAAKAVQPFVGAVPMLGNVVGAVATGAGMVAGAADTANKAIGIGQNIVRTGASAFNNASTAGDVMSAARDIQRQGGAGMKSLGSLQKQVKEMGSKLQKNR